MGDVHTISLTTYGAVAVCVLLSASTAIVLRAVFT